MSHSQQTHAAVGGRSSSMSSSSTSASATGGGFVGSATTTTTTTTSSSLFRSGSSSLASSTMSSTTSSSSTTMSSSLSSSSIRDKPPSLLGSLSGSSGTIGIGAMSSSMSSKAGSTTGSSENLPPRTLARVARDVRDLVRSPPEGVRLVLDGETGMPGSLSEIMAEIEGPEQTPYHTRYFQLKLVLSADFPSTPPRGYFLTKIYHPNVDTTTGAICVNTLKNDWTPSTTIGHVLTVIRCLLIVPFPESSLNDEAGRMFMDSYDEYARRARLLAGVHGLTGWSSSGNVGGGGGGGGGDDGGVDKDDNDDDDDDNDAYNDEDDNDDDHKKKAAANPAGGNARLGKTGSRGNIVRTGSKMLDKKNKKKSLRRL